MGVRCDPRQKDVSFRCQVRLNPWLTLALQQTRISAGTFSSSLPQQDRPVQVCILCHAARGYSYRYG